MPQGGEGKKRYPCPPGACCCDLVACFRDRNKPEVVTPKYPFISPWDGNATEYGTED